jgi:pyruvate dehydrogenase E2 component (dihydrolipoamide acetyltransferase)
MEFKLADIGEGTQEAEILHWLVTEGEAVREDQPLLEVQTDKVTAELPSPWNGIVTRRLRAEGDVVRVGETLLEIDVAGGSLGTGAASTAAQRPREIPAATAPAAPLSLPAAAGRVLASPATRRRAREWGIDLAAVPGTGPAGRVTPEDLQRYREMGSAVPQEARNAAAPPHAAAPPSSPPQELPERQALQGLRRVIARNMTESHRDIPTAAQLDDCDVTELVALRRSWNEELRAMGTDEHLTLLPFVLKAAAVAIRRHPTVGVRFDSDRQEIVRQAGLHIGIAVDTPDGLIVPVVRDVDRLSLRQLAQEVARLADAARRRALVQGETEGGVFSVTNHGAFGGVYGLPIVRRPEVAILGIGRVREEPVVRDGAIVARAIMHFSIAFDHRVLDGADVGRFALTLRELLEHPQRLLLEVQ